MGAERLRAMSRPLVALMAAVAVSAVAGRRTVPVDAAKLPEGREPQVPSAIVRWTIGTGSCELATPPQQHQTVRRTPVRSLVMRQKNGRLVIAVAAVAVAAVVIGGVLAYRTGPRTENDAARPLSGQTTPAATPSKTPSTSPTPPTTSPTTPTATPSAAGPAKVVLKLSKLPTGRAPQVAYLVGREVRGGAGQPVKIPGTGQIQEVARLGDEVLAVVTKGEGTELLKIGYAPEPERTPDVTSVVTTDDETTAAAYATTRTGPGGQALRGSTVYAYLAADDQVHKISLPKAWDTRVLAYQGGKIWFRGGDSDGATSWRLYTWVPGTPRATEVKTISSPTGLTRDGTVAASRNVSADFGTCSSLTQVSTGKRLWRTCEYQITSFTPDGTVAVGAPAHQDGYADLMVSALDTNTGAHLKQWTGLSFKKTVVEDDQHFLILADDGPETNAAIIRCSITTAACELATPLTTQELVLGS